MSKKRQKRKKIKENLFNKRRLIILNEDTFEETFSLKLTLMNVFISATLGAIIIITVTTFIIAFTPLREYIPGYSSTKLKKEATELALKADSLSYALKKNEDYIKSIQKVLVGELDIATYSKDSILTEKQEIVAPVNLNPSKKELELRERVAKEEKEALSDKAKSN